MSRDKEIEKQIYRFVRQIDRPWWKVLINTFLRAIQPGLRRKWVIYSIFEGERLVGYGFGRITHLIRVEWKDL